MTFLIYSAGWIATTSIGDGSPIDALDIAALYLWNFVNAIPLAQVTETLQWPQPLVYDSHLVGGLILTFQIVIIAPVVTAVSEAWKKRGERSARYRRDRADDVARRLGLD